MSELDFSAVIASLGCNEVELRDNYDAVFHLVTAAKGAEQFYTTANNAARTETVEQSAELDDKLIAAWTGHPHLRIIDNAAGFDDKLKKLIAEIAAFLGEPEPFEIERKFLIEYPDIAKLEKLPNCQRVEIIQTYLTAPEGEESRVRQRGGDGNYIYVQTTKKKVTDVKRVEVERRLTKDEYLRLLMDVVVELKHPDVRLGEKQLSQVKKYMNVIMSVDQFNAPNMTWEFYLVGNTFTSDNFIKNEIDSNKGHGERSLVFKVDRYKIYVKTWSEVFAEFQVRYDYLLKKLSLDRQKLQQSYQSADEVIDAQKESTARMPEEITVG